MERIKKPEILWCYKKELDLSSYQQKTLHKKGKLENKGDYNSNTNSDVNSFSQFLNANKDVIKQIKYDDSQKILGKTFGILILQDFEAITPNLLCRTIETVRGGGTIIFLFKGLKSLKQVHSIYMDFFNKLKTSNIKEVEARFNERFIKSLIKDNRNFLAIDDEMNVLELSKDKVSNIERLPEMKSVETERDIALNSLKRELISKKPIGSLVEYCFTLDQAKCVMQMVDSISEKSALTTVGVFSGRGRGKSAAMGIAIGSAIVFRYSNICVTAPSPENVQTFFEFCVKSIEKLGYSKKKDYELVMGNDKETSRLIVGIEIFKDHKQTISYICPQSDPLVLRNCELLVIDEAAAIPLYTVKKLMVNCLTFMASTIQGYEGTGRSLSLKLISKIKEESSRAFKEITLDQAIRYADNDPVENWLNKLLCLDCVKDNSFLSEYPHIDECELYLVNKDTLFSYKKTSEAFLNSVMSLFVSSHYKNSPNDLQLISDSTSHQIFILTKNLKKTASTGELPEIYCVIQAALEGGIGKDIIDRSKESDNLPPGDLIPWTLSNYFLDSDFPKLKGVRVVRIASHPSAHRMGYGKKALELLFNFYQGKYFDITKVDNVNTKNEESKQSKGPLLTELSEAVLPENFSYIGTSFGLTNGLYKFWKDSGFTPTYLRTLQNQITGEYSCIMIKQIKNENIRLNQNSSSTQSDSWLEAFSSDFSKRIQVLLSYEFKKLRVDLASELLLANQSIHQAETMPSDTKNGHMPEISNAFYGLKQLQLFFTKEDFKRLQRYSQGLLTANLVLDLVPNIATMFFGKKTSKNLSPEQSMILIGLGLQRKSFEEIESEIDSIKKEKGNRGNKNVSNFGIDQTTIMGMFKKIMIKFTDYLKKQYETEFSKADEFLLKESSAITDLKLNNTDDSMKINPKDDLFKKDEKAMKQDKQVKTDYYGEKFTNKKREKTGK
eukprot:CAMPEP_0170526410 /NCGR_PEP_ID=MMETSP0209-20121228/11825_1 /TAXON_ID=665100 ORGANISM="Litonotus pictus, Strain P1" /NCGR_SAMPLE_ID=MMETSP0209 /ASSEMBLY_ACC=CAM_ASM_000301 /LENGTH=949 /DNA_ID=CAMNT_0010816205 /DNA_START=159 /DNA_END=3008 /DNA_ORIENTATION=-